MFIELSATATNELDDGFNWKISGKHQVRLACLSTGVVELLVQGVSTGLFS
jgi:hypothetical protein